MVVLAALPDAADAEDADVEALAALPDPEEQPESAAAMAAVAPTPMNPRLVMFSMLLPPFADCWVSFDCTVVEELLLAVL